MAQVYVSIGSNIDPQINIVNAVKTLRQQYNTILLSPVYRSAAVGFEGDEFLNLVAGIDTAQTLEEIKKGLMALERQFGRKDSHKGFQSRTLDLDLLLYNDVVRHDDQFDLPRAEIEQYAFVLRPLSDIAPDRLHPESGRTLGEMWHNFTGSGSLQTFPLDLD
ncbi:MAG: 2-amino-4-hydroxy-6-hydroxymethyldihydropteridine diphosphokinase [Acidiferrobacterales bacterium]